MKARLPQGYSSKGAGNPMKQAQKMQEDLARLTEEIEAQEFTATAGGGAVEITATGKKEIKSLNIKPEVIDPEDKEMLEDMIIAAVNEVIRKIEDTTNEQMESITGGLNIPGLF